MITKMFTVRDAKAEIYLTPFYMQTKGQAIRAFQDSVNDPQHMIGKHPEDFTLFEIGEYDDTTAKHDLLETPHSLGVAIEFVQNTRPAES